MQYPVRILLGISIIAGSGQTATLSGTVRGADGSIVAKALVTVAGRSTPAAPRHAQTSRSIQVSSSGSFEAAGLDLGAYQVCVTAPGSAWLDSCEWGQAGSLVALTPTQQTASLTITLAMGALVTVRANDPSQLLSTNEGKTPGAHLLIGVGGDSLAFHPAVIVSQDSGGRNYQVLIPFDRSLKLSVASALFQVTNQAGAALPQFGNLLPLSVASGQNPATIFLNVTGLAAVSPGPR